jgi:phosphate transport system substrate-binding protein
MAAATQEPAGMFHRVTIFVCAALLATWAVPSAADTIRIGGTGGAIGMLSHLAKPFAQRTGIVLDVVPSLGSGGGIRAVADGAIDLSVTGRLLTETERARGLTEAATLRTPYVFATSNVGPVTMTAHNVVAVFGNKLSAWPDGSPIKQILRPRLEDDNAVIAAFFAEMPAAMAIARERGELPVATTDQDSADLAESLAGSFIGATYTQLTTEKRDLRFITIDGVEPTMDTFETGRYRLGKVFRIVARHQPGNAVEQFLQFLTSNDGTRALRDAGCLPGSE